MRIERGDITMTNIEIGNRIKYVRNLRNVTLDTIAQKVGVAKSTVQRYESGKIESIKLPVIESIANALNVNPAWIVGKSDLMELPSQKIPKIMQYYNQLNDLGKHEAIKRVEELTYLPQYSSSYEVNAAHERTDIEIPEDVDTSDDDIMNDENF